MPVGKLRIEKGRIPREGDLLRNYLEVRWRAICNAADHSGGALGPGELPAAMRSDLGDQAELFRDLADRLIRGAVEEYGRSPGDEAQVLDSLTVQLSAVLAGLRRDLPASPPAPANAVEPEGRPQMLQSRLWQVVHKIRESGDLAYGRVTDLPELDRRILFLLRRRDEIVPADVSLSLGIDKAQVSRSVKRLLADGLIDRDQLRSPLRLTETGIDLVDRLLVVADLRDRELVFDIGKRELAEFKETLEVFLDRAALLYEQESAKSDGSYAIEDKQRRMQIDHRRIISPLMTVLSYMSRSGAISYKRLTGLSNFETWVLTEISFDPPTDWKSLVGVLQRDHSQAGRTVNSLIDRGLVKREGRLGRRHGRFSPTEEGVRLYQIILKSADTREAFLTETLSEERMGAFLATFEKLQRNAIAQLDRERTIQELAKR